MRNNLKNYRWSYQSAGNDEMLHDQYPCKKLWQSMHWLFRYWSYCIQFLILGGTLEPHSSKDMGNRELISGFWGDFSWTSKDVKFEDSRSNSNNLCPVNRWLFHLKVLKIKKNAKKKSKKYRWRHQSAGTDETLQEQYPCKKSWWSMH